MGIDGLNNKKGREKIGVVVIYLLLFGFIVYTSTNAWMSFYIFLDFNKLWFKKYQRKFSLAVEYINYKIDKYTGKFHVKMDNEEVFEEDFYNLLHFNYEIDRIKTPFEREEVKKDLVDVMILLKKYKMAGYVIESEIKEVVDKDRYLEKYTPLLSYIYYKVGDKDKSDKYMSEFISHLKGIRKIEEEKKEIEKKRNEILKKKGRYFKYKKDYYDFLLED